MINNPYEILEVSKNASNDEIKKAYRELSRKYHPDSYVDNPLADLAEEKFKQVQEAYQQIMKEREQGYSSNGGSSSYSSSNMNQNYGGGDSQEMNTVISYLNNRRYVEALNLLHRITSRTSRWYYCSAVANHGMGNIIMAQDHAKQALSMEPNNRDYISLVNQLNWQGQRYQNTRYGGNQSFGTGNLCCDLWCADSLCECMGGDLCACM